MGGIGFTFSLNNRFSPGFVLLWSMAQAKAGLHSRNQHRNGYDFEVLSESAPALQHYLVQNKRGQTSINFHDAAAVKCLNQALLLHHYKLDYWDIPHPYLCPAVPGRADYLHHLADLMAQENGGRWPKGSKIRCLDIGTGANLVYPIIGTYEYGWSFVGTDIDDKAIETARTIWEKNARLKQTTELRLQTKRAHLLQGIITKEDYFDLVMCNPPFYSSAEEAQNENRRKKRGLKAAKGINRNFAGQAKELWCPGGEKAFISQLIQESYTFPKSCYWFTSLVARETHLKALVKQLEQVKATAIKTIPMAQGNKVSRILAWSFLNDKQKKAWRGARW